jgi:hypothetical protein
VTDKPLVYLTGPYTNPDPVLNVRAAVELADELVHVCTPFVPHLTHLWHLVSPKPYPDWLALDLEYLERCDALARFGGASAGADAELDHARRLGMPTFEHVNRAAGLAELLSWCDTWSSSPELVIRTRGAHGFREAAAELHRRAEQLEAGS